jgi:hypothetical protein
VSYWDVYVDDFIGLCQGNQSRRLKVKRYLLHTLDLVLRKLDPTDSPHRQEPASISKLLKGDATWTTRKAILGWIIDTTRHTVELPPHRQVRLAELLLSIRPGQRRIATKRWHQVLGELRSMVLAIPGARGLFSTLQQAFQEPESATRLRLHKHVHDFLDDFRWLARDLSTRPTRIAELIPASQPATLGACDASGSGMGGVHFVPLPNHTIQPLVWCSRFPARFPAAVASALVSRSNPSGTISNSDLELAGSIAHHDILYQ